VTDFANGFRNFCHYLVNIMVIKLTWLSWVDVTGINEMRKDILIFFLKNLHEQHLEYRVTWKSNMIISTEK